MAGDMRSLRFGTFSCIAVADPLLDSSFLKEVVSVKQNNGWNDLCPGFTSCIINIPYLDVEITKPMSSSSESSEENSDSWSYDEGHAPRVGDEYQCTFIPPRTEETIEDNHPNLGELVWDPTRIEMDPLTDFLEQTKVPVEYDIDDVLEVLESEEEPDLSKLEPIARNFRENLWTQEDALNLLSSLNYDTEKAVTQMKEGQKTWSPKKRHIGAVWARADIEKFELGLHNHDKDFRTIVKNELLGSKTYTAAVQYYYIWKKTLRCKIWLKRNKSLYGVPSLPVVADGGLYARNKAPVKADGSLRHLASEGRLRNRPRVDYSTTGWVQGKEPRRKENSDEPESADGREDKREKRHHRHHHRKPKEQDKEKGQDKENQDGEKSDRPELLQEPGGPVEESPEEGSSSPEGELEQVKMEIEPATDDQDNKDAQSLLNKLQEDEKLNDLVERKKASPSKISITSRLKNVNQKSLFPFRTHLKHGHHYKRRRVEPTSPKTPSEPGTPEMVDEEYDEEDYLYQHELETGDDEYREEMDEELIPDTPEYDDNGYQNGDEDMIEEPLNAEATTEDMTLAAPVPSVSETLNSITTNPSSPPICIITNIDTQPPVQNTTLIMNLPSSGSALINKFVRAPEAQPPSFVGTGSQKGSETAGKTPATPTLPSVETPPTPAPYPVPMPMSGYPTPNFLFPYPPSQQLTPQRQQLQQMQKMQMLHNYPIGNPPAQTQPKSPAPASDAQTK